MAGMKAMKVMQAIKIHGAGHVDAMLLQIFRCLKRIEWAVWPTRSSSDEALTWDMKAMKAPNAMTAMKAKKSMKAAMKAKTAARAPAMKAMMKRVCRNCHAATPVR